MIIAGRREQLLSSITAEHPGMESVAMDVTDPDSIRSAVADKHPDLNGVINNAGMMLTPNQRIKIIVTALAVGALHNHAAVDTDAVASMFFSMTSLTHLSAPTLAEQAYEALRRAIVAGELVRGQKVTERALAGLLNISPTPVREAIRRLEQDRLVQRRGLREVVVSDFDETEIADISLIEETLRALAARLAAARASQASLEAMANALDEADAERQRLSLGGDQAEAPSDDGVHRIWSYLREFHRLLDEACGSPMLLHMLRMADAFESGERRAVLHVEMRARPSTVETRYYQHRAIFDAVRSGDGGRAELLMLEHSHAAAAPRLDSRTP